MKSTNDTSGGKHCFTKIYCNYSEPHSQNRIFDASILLMWLPRHIKLLFCLNASIHRKQFCMALNSYHFLKPRRSIYRSNEAFCLFVINQTILFVIILSTRMFYSASEDASSVETSSEDTSSEDTSEDASSETSSEDSSSISTKVTFSESFPNT